MKIAFVNQPFSELRIPLQSDSLGIWSYEVARRMAGDAELRLYTKQLDGSTPVRESHDGVDFVRVPTASDDARHRRLERFRRLLRRVGLFRDPTRPFFASRLYASHYARHVAQDLRRWDCDVVHLHNFSQFVPILRRFNPRATIVLNMQCEWLNQLDRSMLEPRLRHADLILGCSEYIANKTRERFPDFASRCFALVNGVDVERFVPADDADDPRPGDERRLVFVGRVSPEKGIHVLLEAFAAVVAKEPRARLEIIGPQVPAPREYILDLDDDPRVKALAPMFHRGYRKMIVRRVAAEVSDRVTFVKNIPADEVIERYRTAELVVFPSVWNEPFGMPIVEAMACGVPVVTTRGGGIPEIVADGETGLLVDRGDARGLAEAMLRILERPDSAMEMGRRGRKVAVDRYSWRHVASALEQRIAEATRRA